MAGTSELRSTVGLVTVAEMAAANLLLVGPLRRLLPGGVAPGSTVRIDGSVGLGLAFAAAVGGTERWVAGIGWGRFGLVAARELGVSWGRLVLVDPPAGSWVTAVAAALDAFDVVIACPPARVAEREVRRLSARTRERSAVLVTVGSPGSGAAWPGADIGLRVAGRRWEGLDPGHGHLQRRAVVVEATGRGRLAQGRRLELWLPGVDGFPVEMADRIPRMAAGGPGVEKPVEERAVS